MLRTSRIRCPEEQLGRLSHAGALSGHTITASSKAGVLSKTPFSPAGLGQARVTCCRTAQRAGPAGVLLGVSLGGFVEQRHDLRRSARSRRSP